MVNLSVESFNVKGLANDKKRKEIFHWLHEKNMNIYVLQETHSSNANVNIFQDDWEGRYLFSNKNTASADVMILFNTNFEYKLENVVTDSDERELLNAILFRQIHTLQGLPGIVVFRDHVYGIAYMYMFRMLKISVDVYDLPINRLYHTF